MHPVQKLPANCMRTRITMEMLMVTGWLSVAASVFGVAPDAVVTLPVVDSLVLYLQDQRVGKLVSSLVTVAGGFESRTVVSVAMPDERNSKSIELELEELRRFDHAGNLASASQEMTSAAGVNRWRLTPDATAGWVLAVTTAGVTNKRRCIPPHEQVNTQLSIYRGIQMRSLRRGDVWNDTSCELTSGTAVITVTRLEATPQKENGLYWIFACENSITKRTEQWMVDTAGHTVYRDVYPYVARSITYGNKLLTATKKTTANLFDMMKVAASRRVRSGEQVVVAMGGEAIDSSVLQWYTRTGDDGWALTGLVATCSSKTATEPLPDRLLPFLQSTPTLQVDHPKIAEQVALLNIDKKESACARIGRFNHYVYKLIRKENSATFSSAVETLDAGYGDCGEHAVLLAALLRAAGIPARVVLGLLYIAPKKGYYYHAWVVAYAGGNGIFADPSHDTFPACNDRIPLMIDDTGENLLRLGGVVGRVTVVYKKK